MNRQDPAEQDIKSNKIKEGSLVMRSRLLKQWKQRWIVLTKSFLYSFQNKGIYRSPVQKIPLREITTIKSFYKNQYERSQVCRVESDDNYFYLSATDHQEKWAWVTAIQKTTQAIRNPSAFDSQNLVRQSLRMSSAVRQSHVPRKSYAISKNQEEGPEIIIKKMSLKLNNHVLDLHLNMNIGSSKKIQKVTTLTEPKVIQKIVEVEKIVEKIVYIQTESKKQQSDKKEEGSGLSELFAVLINSKIDDPYPLLDFVAFLALTGVEYYQNVAIKFCCQQDSHRFFAELLLQALNEETSQVRLNRFTGFIYILCEREPDYFYASDIRILSEILLRELELYRSDLNQMINLQVLKTILTYHQNLLMHKRYDIEAIVSEIANLGPTQNRQLSVEICQLIS